MAKSRRKKLIAVAACIIYTSALLHPPKLNSADPLTVFVLATSLLSIVVRSFESGADPTGTAVLQSRELILHNRELIKELHLRFDVIGKALEAIMDKIDDLPQQMEKSVENGLETFRAKKILGVIDLIVQSMSVRKEGEEPSIPLKTHLATLQQESSALMRNSSPLNALILITAAGYELVVLEALKSSQVEIKGRMEAYSKSLLQIEAHLIANHWYSFVQLNNFLQKAETSGSIASDNRFLDRGVLFMWDSHCRKLHMVDQFGFEKTHSCPPPGCCAGPSIAQICGAEYREESDRRIWQIAEILGGPSMRPIQEIYSENISALEAGLERYEKFTEGTILLEEVYSKNISAVQEALKILAPNSQVLAHKDPEYYERYVSMTEDYKGAEYVRMRMATAKSQIGEMPILDSAAVRVDTNSITWTDKSPYHSCRLDKVASRFK